MRHARSCRWSGVAGRCVTVAARGLALPVNASGGLLSQSRWAHAGAVVELTWQLRGAAGARQVAGARTALAHAVGRGANACVTILQR